MTAQRLGFALLLVIAGIIPTTRISGQSPDTQALRPDAVIGTLLFEPFGSQQMRVRFKAPRGEFVLESASFTVAREETGTIISSPSRVILSETANGQTSMTTLVWGAGFKLRFENNGRLSWFGKPERAVR
jgi:hypothetical protein